MFSFLSFVCFTFYISSWSAQTTEIFWRLMALTIDPVWRKDTAFGVALTNFCLTVTFPKTLKFLGWEWNFPTQTFSHLSQLQIFRQTVKLELVATGRNKINNTFGKLVFKVFKFIQKKTKITQPTMSTVSELWANQVKFLQPRKLYIREIVARVLQVSQSVR